MLALGGIALLVGFGFMTYEGSRFGDHAYPWHHFWFDFGVGWLGFAGVLVICSLTLFIKEQRRPEGEQELTSRERSTDREGVAGTGEIMEETEIKRRFR